MLPGYDTIIYQTYLDRHQPALAVMVMQERNTWGHSYPVLTTELDRLVGGYQSPSIDGYLKYLSQCSGIGIHVADVFVWRQHVQATETFTTPVHQRHNKEVLFRENAEMKDSLLEDCLAVLSHDQYVTLDEEALSDVQSSWLEEPFIRKGPTGIV